MAPALIAGVLALLVVGGAAGWWYGIEEPRQEAVRKEAAAKHQKELADAKAKADEAQRQKELADAKAKADEAERKQLAAEAEKKRIEDEAKEQARIAEAQRQKELADAKAKADEEAKKNPFNASKENPWENSLGMKFVPVAGTGVIFSVWDTRVRDFRAYAEATGYKQTGGFSTSDGEQYFEDAKASWERPGFDQTDYHPVVGVSWAEAKAFCKWLTERERAEGKIGKDQEYRLPTDAEWSAAVGSGKYPWGNEWPPPKGAGNYHSSLGVDSYEGTSPVGSFPTNRFGLNDMGGNVWQWCEDWYRTGMNEEAVLEKYSRLKEDGGGQKYRVLRGGSRCNYAPEFLLSSYRLFGYPYARDEVSGFRCVLVGGSSR